MQTGSTPEGQTPSPPPSGTGSGESAIGCVYVFFPVFNEGAAARSLFERVCRECGKLGLRYRVLIVDDGSTDDSMVGLGSPAQEGELTVISHGGNRGLKEALATGLAWLRKAVRPEDVVIMLDGDDTHDPAHFGPMLDEIAAGAGLVICSRYRKGAKVIGLGRFREVLSRGASLWGRLFFRLPGVRDFACGFRAFRAAVLLRAFEAHREKLFELEGFGFICSVELLLRLAGSAGRIAEVPMVLHYERKKGPSKMNAARTAQGYWALRRSSRRWQ
jgi:dolichol-phosphate mannosyltransferase